LRSVNNLLSNETGDTEKKKVTSVKHKPAGGIAMPGGLLNLLLGRRIGSTLYD